MLANNMIDRPTRMARDLAMRLLRVVSSLEPFIMKTRAAIRLPSMATNAMKTRYFMDWIIA